jgi:hypothetical protein
MVKRSIIKISCRIKKSVKRQSRKKSNKTKRYRKRSIKISRRVKKSVKRPSRKKYRKTKTSRKGSIKKSSMKMHSSTERDKSKTIPMNLFEY